MCQYTVKDALDALDEAFPLSSQDGWDNSGLLVGNPDDVLTGVLLSLDITEDAVSHAIRENCNLIVAHHPLMFHGLKRLVGASAEQRVIMTALRNGIALIAFHTPADKSIDGTSGSLGRLLGLTDMHVLAPDSPTTECGYGIVGSLPSPLALPDFLAIVKSKLSTECFRYSYSQVRPELAPSVRKVAICTGSGSEFAKSAAISGADFYITADVKYHQMMDISELIPVADIGHYESEIICTSVFFSVLSRKFRNFARYVTHTDCNPVKYYY
ncbi:MAG: Nif3-like dinuclear metal center hexameric protein [Bacteroidales bacterium]|nr:Nif3-like dinuclear metal center hexameric protein [Bacteroidales bacterium]